MIAVLGGGGHGTDIAYDLREQGHAVRVYDDELDGCLPLCAYVQNAAFTPVVGVNSPCGRLAVVDRLGLYPDVRTRWVHRSAILGPDVTLGGHTHINAGCTVTRASLAEFCTVGPGVNICGDVTIGAFVAIGAGATISNLVTIGEHVTIGAGAVVTPHTVIPDGETWVGVPARRIR